MNTLSLKCNCEFSSAHITDNVFLCDPSSPGSVTYQAQLHGTLQANVSQLVDIMQALAMEHRSIPVQLALLTIQHFCVVSETTTAPCTITTDTMITASTTINASTTVSSNPQVNVTLVVIATSIILILVAATIVFTMLLVFMARRHKYKLKIMEHTVEGAVEHS